MARTSFVSVESRPEPGFYDLSRFLDRLQTRLLHPTTAKSSNLRTSYDRNKLRANLEYARTLLRNLERSQQTVSKTVGTKAATVRLAELEEKRALLRKLQHRLVELNQTSDNATDDEAESSDSDADDALWDRYAPARSTAPDGISPREPTTDKPGIKTGTGPKNSGPGQPTTGGTLRSRKPAASAATTTDVATTTSSATATAASAMATASAAAKPGISPFAPKNAAATDGSGAGTGASDTLMAHHAAEQERITASLLTLATALKTSTQSFSDTLAESNPIVDRATSALDRNVSGMQAAEKRMGMLRRMTEGRGWWARISLYGWIAVLWVAAILLVFVLPKLRF